MSRLIGVYAVCVGSSISEDPVRSLRAPHLAASLRSGYGFGHVE